MGIPALPCEVMLFSSVLFGDSAMADKAIAALKETYGRAGYQSEPIPFSFTSYYREEMGSPLYRVLLAFDILAQRDCLPEAKTRSNEIEDMLKAGGKRTVNLDPGILSMENICLATTKPYSHRIYLRKGIWAEITLIYKKDSYQALPWTYPDYASPELISIFNELRNLYKEKLRCPGA
ncbi:MAG TPA: DUF4416 family protein [Deltaproteobacteria bacterium]|mgnify:FL=1|nr:DUF4416 family protein [Deltaproteobacteria bacterium]HQI01209.1 DUF4416 family protein [Deltaproteobacteria bacterium]HQJ08494.1 DUF4416 family protein [Deltaproteobacteria bacterium]